MPERIDARPAVALAGGALLLMWPSILPFTVGALGCAAATPNPMSAKASEIGSMIGLPDPSWGPIQAPGPTYTAAAR